MADDTPQSFICPLTLEMMTDPVTAADGHSYECSAITAWLRNSALSPLTGEQLPHKQLTRSHALRNAIQEHVQLKKKQHNTIGAPVPPPSSGSSSATVDVSDAAVAATPHRGVSSSTSSNTPQGMAVDDADEEVSIGVPPYGLSASDYEYCAAFTVPDWMAHCQPGKKKAGGGGLLSTLGLVLVGGGGISSKASPRKTASAAAEEPKLRAKPAEGGGVALEAIVSSGDALLTLARRLGARGSGPIAALTITGAHDGYGPGTAASGAYDDAFRLLSRALSSLSTLRELSISKVVIDDETAKLLALGLSGHPSLTSLELWNVGLQDEGALSIARVAANGGSGSAPSLTSLNLGRNILSPETRERIESLVDKERVQAKLY